ncbi:MAG: WecB/TagA/CpsF family glycosyltransferase [Chloroflexi bacterium]|nr:WecB/TagA/CpsF family glycosyltransferase [Chloroflexota bacterium]
MKTPLRRAYIMGCILHETDMDTGLATINEMLSGDGFSLVVTLSTEMVMNSRSDPGFKKLLEEASLVVPDTSGIFWAGRRAGLNLKEKVAGIDLAYNLLERAGDERKRVFLLGSAPGVAEKAADNMKKRFPRLEISGIQHGFFSEGKEEDEIIDKIKRANTDIILCGMGSPRQEIWLKKHGPKTGAKVGIGVGGSLDVMAGELKRAPKWMIDLHLEWLFRLIQQPARIGRMTILPVFCLSVMLSPGSLKKCEDRSDD